MVISIFIVTYRSPADLNNNIASILASGADVRINVINNHSEFSLAPEHERAVTVLHNRLRPDFSTGHLARNWNQALLHGFQDLNKPVSDVVVAVHDDVIFKKNWLYNLLELHRRYSFITMGAADSFCSYLPEAVRRIGLWDERFCNIGYHAADYLLRALIYNREDSSINDQFHLRVHNPVDGSEVYSRELGSADVRADSMLITLPPGGMDRKNAHVSSMKFHSLTGMVFAHKWGVPAGDWTAEHYAVRKSLAPNYITYPYFERDIENLGEKNYIVPDDF